MTDLPTLDPQQAQDAYDTMLARLAAYAPSWQPVKASPGDALLRIYARYLHVLAERINRAPHKNRLALLDRLGISLIPDQAARAPVVFTMQDGARNSRSPAGLRLGADVPGLDDPVIFETEQAIGLTAARLAEVVTVWPGRDEYADLSVDVIGGQPVTLFDDLEPIPHLLYLAHDTHFALSGNSIVEIQVQLARPSSERLDIAWEYWDGEAWREFKPFVDPNETEPADDDSLDGTDGLTRSGVVRLVAECGENAKTAINNIEAYWVRARLAQKLIPDPARRLPDIDTLRVRAIITNFTPGSGLQPLDPDAAYAGGIELDVTKAFFPFGQDTQTGATFYLTSEEVLTKPGAQVYVSVRKATTPQQESDTLAGGATLSNTPAEINWEYWNGTRWLTLPDLSTGTVKDFQQNSGKFEFTVPDDLSLTEVAGVEGLWLRARIAEGSFNRFSKISWTPEGGSEITLPVVSPRPVSLESLKLGYDYRAAFAQPQWCFTYSDFQWADRTEDASWRGLGFEPFPTVQDRTPTLYLGFDGPLPPDLISLYFDIEEDDEADVPRLAWEYWDGEFWSPLTVSDGTAHLAMPGMVQVVYPGVAAPPRAYVVDASGTSVTLLDARQAAQFRIGNTLYITNDDGGELATLAAIDGKTLALKTPLGEDYQQASIELAGLARFGTPRAWLRARLQTDGEPHTPTVNGMFPNAVWASQTNTLRDELVGFSNGQRDQVFFLRQTPVLDGDIIEMRELDGPRAEVELPILEEDLRESGHPAGALRVVRDATSGRVTEVWVRWLRVPSLLFSSPVDRHYALESTQGRLRFGDGARGRVPASGVNNIVARQYRTGGGKTGNVPVDAISQVLGAVPGVQSVRNVRAGGGGAIGESIDTIAPRGAATLRHHHQALTAADYEALARQASPAIAVARARPNTDPDGIPAKGWVNLIIIQQSDDPRPQPSLELKQRVARYLQTRAPATVAGRISIDGPVYLPVDVNVTVKPLDMTQAGVVFETVLATLQDFLHPLTGGPDGDGYPFGRDVFLSDVAAVLEGLPGVDYVESIELLLDDVPQGERVPVPPSRIVCAGKIDVRL